MLKTKTKDIPMTKKLLAGSTVLLLAATAAMGAHNESNTPGDYYRANELSLDLFGSGSLGRSYIKDLSGSLDEIDDDSELGLGVGLNYFFTRCFGAGVDAYSENTSGSFVDSASLSLIGRFPIGDSGFAPNVFGGGGRQFEGEDWWFLQLGAGIEYRFTHQIGLFLDARVVWPEETDYYGVARLGVRFAF